MKKKRQGKGIIADILGMIHPLAKAGAVAKAIGLGMRKK